MGFEKELLTILKVEDPNIYGRKSEVSSDSGRNMFIVAR